MIPLTSEMGQIVTCRWVWVMSAIRSDADVNAPKADVSVAMSVIRGCTEVAQDS